MDVEELGADAVHAAVAVEADGADLEHHRPRHRLHWRTVRANSCCRSMQMQSNIQTQCIYCICVCFFFFEMKKEGSSREEEGRRQRKMVQGLYCTVVWKRHADACMALACREGVVYCSFAWWQKLKQGRQPFCCCCCVLQLSFFLFREEKGEQRLMQHTDALSLSLPAASHASFLWRIISECSNT